MALTAEQRLEYEQQVLGSIAGIYEEKDSLYFYENNMPKVLAALDEATARTTKAESRAAELDGQLQKAHAFSFDLTEEVSALRFRASELQQELAEQEREKLALVQENEEKQETITRERKTSWSREKILKHEISELEDRCYKQGVRLRELTESPAPPPSSPAAPPPIFSVGHNPFLLASEWGDDDGTVLWWTFPICAPPYVGSPADCDWNYENTFTHWQKLDLRGYDNEKSELEAAATTTGEGKGKA